MILMFPRREHMFISMNWLYSLCLKKIQGTLTKRLWIWVPEICKPKNPQCQVCPIQENCLTYETGKVLEFPVKSKKVKAVDLKLHYYYIMYEDKFLIKQRDDSFIWKKLYDFPESISQELEDDIVEEKRCIINLRTKILKSVFLK